MAQSAAAMGSIDSAGFELRRSGAEVRVQGMVFDEAVGQYGAPDTARALLDVRAAGVALQLGTIAVADRTWLTNPLTGDWEELELGTGFNAATVFADDTGWQALLPGMSGARYAGTDGGCSDPRRIGGTLPPAAIETLTLGIVPAQEVEVILLVDATTSRLVSASFETDGEAGTSAWEIVLSDYDAPADIAPPE